MEERHKPSRTPQDPQPSYGKNMVQEPSRTPNSGGVPNSLTPQDAKPEYMTEKMSQPPSKTP